MSDNTKYLKDFVPYEQALALKEIGFDEPCFGRYYYKESYPMLNPNSGETELVFEFGRCVKQTEVTILAPLYQQAFRWFHKEHGLYSSIVPKKSYPDDYVSGVECYINICGGDGKEIGPDGVYSYEEAELECLKKLIEIVKQQPMSNKQQTVVHWLQEALEGTILTQDQTMQVIGLFMQADEMFKEQIMKTARQCHFEGVRQSAKTSQEYIDYAEQYYNETFNK